MVDKIKQAALYYCIPQLIILALGLYLARPLIFWGLCAYTHVNSADSLLYNLNRLASTFLPAILWAAVAYSTIRQKHYKRLTGRSYLSDHAKYKRSYSALVDYFQDADPHKLDTSTFPEISWHDAKGIVFGKSENKLITIPSNSECNIAVFGPPGSGKTSGIAIINAMTFDGSVLAIDIKGDIYNYVRQHSDRKIIRFCPDDADAMTQSYHFNPFAGLIKMDTTDRKLYLTNLATILIPDEGGTDGNYFTSRARKYLQGIIYLLLQDNPDISFPGMIHAALQGNAFDWVKKALDGTHPDAAEYLASFYGNNEKNISGVYDTLCAALIPFSNPILDELLTQSNQSISIDMLEQGYDIYLQITQEHLDAYAPLFTLILQSFSTAFTKRPDSSTGINNRPILQIWDEFPQLTFTYKMVNANLSTLRSKGIICMLLQQNMSQLEIKYKQEGARTIIGHTNYQIILGSNDPASSKAFSDMFGTRKILKTSNSTSHSQKITTGRSISETKEPVYPPEEFGDLPSHNAAILYFKGKHCQCQKLNCYKQ